MNFSHLLLLRAASGHECCLFGHKHQASHSVFNPEAGVRYCLRNVAFLQLFLESAKTPNRLNQPSLRWERRAERQGNKNHQVDYAWIYASAPSVGVHGFVTQRLKDYDIESNFISNVARFVTELCCLERSQDSPICASGKNVPLPSVLKD